MWQLHKFNVIFVLISVLILSSNAEAQGIRNPPVRTTPFTRGLLYPTEDANELRPDLELGYINVKDDPYLAKGDNSNDDTAEIQAALDAAYANGLGVWFPKGTYVTSSVLNHKGNVNIKGNNCNDTIISSSASICMQADDTNPASGCLIEDIRLVGADYGYHTNSENQTRMTFRRCYLDGGTADGSTPPTAGYGIYANSQWIECKLDQCVVTQLAWFSGSAMNNNVCDTCRFNATGSEPADSNIVYVGDSAGTKQNFTFRNCTFEVGGLALGGSSGQMDRVTVSNCIFADAHDTGDDAIAIYAGNHIILENITAEGYDIVVTGTPSWLQARNIYAYKVDWNNMSGCQAWNIQTTLNQDLSSAWNTDGSSFMLHEGTLYGGLLTRRVAIIHFAGDSAASDTWRRVIDVTRRSARVTALGFVTESNVTGDATNYATLTFYRNSGGNVLGSYAFTLGNDATAYTVIKPTCTAGQNNTDGCIEIRKTIASSGLQLPAMTVYAEYYEYNL